MRPAAVIKFVGAAVLLIAGIVVATPVARADFAECVEACAEQYAIDKQACQDTLDATLADLAEQALECYELTDPISIGICLRDVNIRRAQANNAYKKCLSFANTVAWNCYLDCQASRNQP